jgi:hypothetical protein
LSITTENLYAYLAGIIDGEGSLMIRKDKARKECHSPTYSPRIGVKNINEDVIKLLKQTFGGHYHQDKKIYTSLHGFKSNHKMWSYNVEHKIAYEIIDKIYPFLVIKRKQAETLLRLRDLKNKNFRKKVIGTRTFKGQYGQLITVNTVASSDEYLNQCESLYKEVKRLNHL